MLPRKKALKILTPFTARTILIQPYARAWLLPRTVPLLIAGALISLRAPPSTICFLGVKVPCAKLLARPRRSRICARASSRDIVGLKAALLGSAGRVVLGVRSGGFASGMRVVVEMVWNVLTVVVFSSSSVLVGLLGKVGTMVVFPSSLRVGLLGL